MNKEWPKTFGISSRCLRRMIFQDWMKFSINISAPTKAITSRPVPPVNGAIKIKVFLMDLLKSFCWYHFFPEMPRLLTILLPLNLFHRPAGRVKSAHNFWYSDIRWPKSGYPPAATSGLTLPILKWLADFHS